jgi:hypothetical protein
MTTTSPNRVGLLINGHPFLAEPANAGTKLYDVAGRQVISSAGPDQLISVTTEALDTELADRAASMRRVKAAAAGPFTPKAQRPSARQKAVRQAAREYHSAVWNAGYSQAQADAGRRPLTERITVKDTAELIELVLGKVLANPELRAQYVAAAEAVELESLLVEA